MPAVLRHAVEQEGTGAAWLASLGSRLDRAVRRWDLVVGAPFASGMAAWTAPARTAAGTDAVLKLSFPHPEAREEAAALAAWHGHGAVDLLGADAGDQALLLRRLHPGTSLRDASLPVDEHLAAGADVLRRLADVHVPSGAPFQDLAEVAHELAEATEERIARTLPHAPYAVDLGLGRLAVDLLRTLPASATRFGLAHGDLNPGNVLRRADPSPAHGPGTWLAIDPKPVHGDLAWDPWPLLTQVGDWVDVTPAPAVLAARTRLVAGITDLDPARVAAWCAARSVASGLWAADRGWWTGFRGADGDLERAGAWAATATLLGG